MLKFLRLAPKPPPREPEPEPKPIPLPYIPWTLELWQKSGEHVVYARNLLREPKFRDLLAVLNNSRPRGLNTPDATGAAIALGRREGFDQLLGVLLALGDEPFTPPDHVEPTYGAEHFNLDRA